MHAKMFEDQWRQFRRAVDDVLERYTAAHAGAVAGSRVRAGLRSLAEQACRRGLHRQALAGVMITSAILGATYIAAATLVDGAASHSQARAARSMVLQLAAANYRQARAECQLVDGAGRESCIAEAHAEESRARAMATLAPHSQLAALRLRTDAAIDAGDNDSIVIEPACNVVMRGQVSTCEIQVRSGAAVSQSGAGTGRTLGLVRASMDSASAWAAAPAGFRSAPRPSRVELRENHVTHTPPSGGLHCRRGST
ncbi:MAG: hypothetical protein IPM02_04855 [Betaproteobacteria bacterium]|nr:hypothetical protein [Betaproteobacteria bacterium]